MIDKKFVKPLKTNRIAVIATLILGTVISYYLYFPPQVGLADNADFGRIFSRMGIDRIDRAHHDQFFHFFISEYEIVKPPKVPLNINQVPGIVSLWINNFFRSSQIYSIYYLSLIYFLLYVTGFFLFLKNLLTHIEDNFFLKLISAGISLLILSDILFVSYFNSFAQEALFLIAGIFVMAFGLQKKINYNFLLVALLVLSLSKPQNIIFLLFPIYIVLFRFSRLNKFILACSIVMTSFFLFFILTEQKQTNKPNLYEAFFMGVLHQASPMEQKEILSYLDFKETGYLKNVNQTYWRSPNDLRNEKSEIYREFYSNIHQKKIIEIYLIHPHLLIRNLTSGINFLQNNSSQPEYLGNYSKKDSVNNRATIAQSPWGKYLNNLFIPIYIFGVISLLFSGNIKQMNRPKKTIIILLITIPVIFTANIVAGGINDFVKHNFSVYFMISLLFILSLIQLGNIWVRKKSQFLNLANLKSKPEIVKPIN